MNSDDRGTITVMTIGFFVLLGLLAVVVINSSDAFLERRELDNLADGAALSAADGLDRDAFYRQGDVGVDPDQARQLVAAYLNGSGVRVLSVSTTADRVQVRIERSVRLALTPPGLPSSTIVRSEATSQLRVAR